ncbi:hypothetical protein FDECE_17747, partial [Fusarium decemcellulare]
MAYTGETAYVIGGASGIGRALATMLVHKGLNIVIADRNIEGAQEAAAELQQTNQTVSAVYVDAADWETQAQGMEAAVRALDRIDYVFIVAGIFEQSWLPNRPRSTNFEKPNLAPLDVNGVGALYATSLAIQQFHRQDLSKYGFRGFVRSLGSSLPEHKITLNAICPGIVKTSISSGDFYEKVDRDGLLVPMQSIMDSFEALMGANTASGDAIEVLPGDAGSRVKERP